jgi:hypothetical protein
MKRVFSIDVLECARRGGRMRIVAAIHPPDAIRKILDCLRDRRQLRAPLMIPK